RVAGARRKRKPGQQAHGDQDLHQRLHACGGSLLPGRRISAGPVSLSCTTATSRAVGSGRPDQSPSQTRHGSGGGVQVPHDATAIERPLCCALPMPAAMLTPMLPTALDSALPLRNAVLSRSHSAIRSFQKVSCSLSALALAIVPEPLTDAASALDCALPTPAATFRPMLPAALASALSVT